MTVPSGKRLSLPRVLAFSTLAMPLAGVGLPLGIYLAPLYADEVGLGLALTGILFMTLRFWDIFTDPVMGFLVDRYKSPLGRVRHWIILSVPVLGLGAWFIYMPPREGAGALYFAGWMLVFYVGFTLLQTARSAWVPAIAADYDDRSRYFLWTEIVSVLFMLVLLAVPAFLEMSGVEADRFMQVRVMGWMLIISLPIAVGLSCLFVPDPNLPGHDGAPPSFTPKAIFAALRSDLLGRVLAMEFFMGTAIAVTSANYLFVAEFIFKISDGEASGVLFLFFLVSVISMPAWLWMSARTQKHTTFAIVMTVAALSYFGYLITAQIGGFVPLLVSAVFNGAAFGAPIVLTRSMTADVIEYELARTGENRSGLYFALLTSSYKIGNAMAFGVGYLILGQVVGFDPAGANTPGELRGLLLVFCLVPATLFLVGAWIGWRFPLTREMQADVAAKLSAGTDAETSS
jgi:Na+/melibiose symporter-like transporter